ncbi:helix-turn-helix domain-containing protein [Nocardioides sp. Y6]|uniref:Helix-turn-helix domain-containing protein n=2 Tax=Nocardioides malaquae TaxID=2773426 RepID=A0ABR9RTV3_9ACTN|nr:helix-turn-helix domain-containing protein [Nocardioides malaquae]
MSPSRTRVLDLLTRSAEPLGMAELTAATGLHANTLRGHLEALVETGLVDRRRATPIGRGRPAWLYTAADESHTSEYAALASTLASGLATSAPDPAAAGARAGEGWGRELARQRLSRMNGPLDPRSEALAALEEFGFAPRDTPVDVVELTRCPLLDTARKHPEVVCAVHLGLVRGMVSEHGGDPSGTTLEPFATDDSCRLHLPRTLSS